VVPLAALLVAALLLVTGCTSDKGEPSTTGQSQTSGTIAAAKSLRIEVWCSAQGPERAFNAKAAA
jgi:ABC-type glycerol-3-phosphate transport system substrate-binding protein